MKVRATIISSLLFASCAFADGYIFTGEVSAELTDYNNYIKVAANPSIWTEPFIADGAEAATELPSTSDIVGIGRYKFTDDPDNIYYGPENMTVSKDFAIGGLQFIYKPTPNSYYQRIAVGSADQDVTFAITNKTTNWFNVQAGFLSGSWGNKTVIFERAADAVDTSVVFDFATFTMAKDTYCLGTTDTGAIDAISFGYLVLWWGGVTLTTYADSIEVLDGVVMNHEATTATNAWEIIVSDKAFDDGSYINVMGYFKKLEDQKITFDFSQIELEEGMVYDLMTVEGEKTGFHDDALADFEFFNTGDIDYSVAWNGDTLQLSTVVVPEAAEVASVLAFAALAFAYIRRRK